MEDRLKHIFGVVNEWLKFAEAKNAALLVAVAALSKPVLDHFPDKAALPTAWWCCTVGCGFLFLSGFLCLGSFLPQLTFKWGASKRPLMATDNLFYFGHIAHLSAFEYLEALYQAEATPPKNKKLEADLAAQIVTNAAIATNKYLHFKIAAWLALVGLILLGSAAKFQLDL